MELEMKNYPCSNIKQVQTPAAILVLQKEIDENTVLMCYIMTYNDRAGYKLPQHMFFENYANNFFFFFLGFGIMTELVGSGNNRV